MLPRCSERSRMRQSKSRADRRAILVLAGLAVSGLLASGTAWASGLPSFAEVRAKYLASDQLLLDRSGIPLQQARVDSNGRRLGWTELAEVSEALKNAVLES